MSHRIVEVMSDLKTLRHRQMKAAVLVNHVHKVVMLGVKSTLVAQFVRFITNIATGFGRIEISFVHRMRRLQLALQSSLLTHNASCRNG